MKFFLACLSVTLFVAGAYAHPCHCEKPPHPPMRPELQEYIQDLKDFVALYPIEEIKQIVGAHLNDVELQNTIAFLRSDEFEDIAERIGDSPEAEAIEAYLKNANWPWARTLMRAAMAQRKALKGHARFAAAPAADSSDSSASDSAAVDAEVTTVENAAGGGLDGLLDDVIAVLPKDELRALFEDKMANREVFRAVVEIMTSDELRQLVVNLATAEHLQPLFQRVEENGIHAEKIREFVRALFGF